MRKGNLIAFLMVMLVLTSCSSNDDDNETKVVTGDYFPSTETSYWNYNVVVKNNNDNTSEDYVDFLSVDITSGTSFDLEVNNGSSAYGTMSGILANSSLTRTDSKLLIDGQIDMPIIGIDDITIDLNNVILYDLNADNNEVLNEITKEFTQTINNIPLTFSYTLTFNKLKDQSSKSVNSTTYTDVTSGNILLTMSVSTTIEVQGADKEFELLSDKDVLSIDSYFAENVGLIQSESVIDYEFDETTILLLEALDVEFDFETSRSVSNTQTITSYVIGD
ncbi:hypothetical protein R3X25_05280 [Lutibacter sp. TH_r2]|uniref:hypothetical protein n=1 Tax=Lutibacter sp. TH_r2 TaxID=3082083 RepID=UPI002953CA9B|nr:hypothetical protein [Lutibacter sp. TH_r2]MDV7186686.1 hypothetical protein [Lutibacter sp. TH_r2]